MKRMPAGKFKAECLKVMDDVSATREPILITKRGRPIAKLVPAKAVPGQFIGRLKGVIKVTGDIESPVEHSDAWGVYR